MFCIYAHYDLDRLVYIGKGSYERMGSCKWETTTYSKLWKNYFKHYKPEVRILKDNLTHDESYYQEWLAIREYAPLLNVKDGGFNGKYRKEFKHSEETKLKMSKSGKGKKRKKEKHPMFGKKQSFNSNAQNAYSNGTRPFIAINRKTNERFGPFYFKAHAAKVLNIPISSNISSCLTGRIPSYKGYKFQRIEGSNV